MATAASRRDQTEDHAAGRRPYNMLGTAAAGFALTFWAWALLSPLGAHFKQSLGVTSFQQALVVAVPVIVGALGRIPVGALTDRHGGRLMFPVISFASIVPVLFLGLAGYRSLPGLLVGGMYQTIGNVRYSGCSGSSHLRPAPHRPRTPHPCYPLTYSIESEICRG